MTELFTGFWLSVVFVGHMQPGAILKRELDTVVTHIEYYRFVMRHLCLLYTSDAADE